MYAEFYSQIPNVKYLFEDLGADGRVILKWILKI
jgi:hypothetical protein